jgi:OOP family OmpA-OmpF porin
MSAALRAITAAALACLAVQGRAFEPILPVGSGLTAERSTSFDTFDAPIGVFEGGAVPTVTLEGEVTRRSWRINSGGLTPLQVMAPIRQQLEDEGYTLVFDCAAVTCGGFDFRFAVEVLPGPNMYVNISRFRYLTAVRGPQEDPVAAVGVLTSVTAGSAYLQVISATTGEPRETTPVVPEPVVVPRLEIERAPETLADALLVEGRVILGDLIFDTGTSNLGAGSYETLAQLAEILRERPDLRVALVGHTDTVGALDPNIAISRARAQSVRDRLVSEYGVDTAQLDAEGMGYLSPVASNLAKEGRARNRRVEVVLLATE